MVTNTLRRGRVCGRLPVDGQQRSKIVLVRHGGQTREQIAQVRQGIFAVALTRDDQGLNNRGALTSVRVADEQPIFFANSRWAKGIFNGVIIDFGFTVIQMSGQGGPLVKQVRTGLAKERLGQDQLAQAQGGFFQQGKGERKMALAQGVKRDARVVSRQTRAATMGLTPITAQQ